LKTILSARLHLLPPLLAALSLSGISQQTSAFYRTPVLPEFTPQDIAKSCIELEREIAAQVPLTYSYRHGFYEDPYVGTAIFVGTAMAPVAYALLLVPTHGILDDRARTQPAEERIAVLRRIKAEKHCFERDT
jgi:hypothetical protein